MKFLNKRSIIIYLIGFMIARAMFYHMNPLAMGYFTAAHLEGVGSGLLFLVIFGGLYTVMPITELMKYILTMVASLIILGSPLFHKREESPFLVHLRYAIPPLTLWIFSLVEGAAIGYESAQFTILFLEMVITYISGYLFRKWMVYVLQAAKGSRMSNEQLLSLAFTLAVFIYAIPQWTGTNFLPVETVVYFILLLCTYKYGIGQGTIAGAISGIAMSFRGYDVGNIGLLALMGMVPAAFRELGRIPTAVIFAVTTGLGGVIFPNQSLTIKEIGALVSAILIFLLLPHSIVYRIDEEEQEIGQDGLAVHNMKKIANTRMRIFSDSFLKLSKTLDSITDKQLGFKENEINGIFEDISEKLCKNCSRCSYCWEDNFSDMYQSTCQMFELAEKNGYLKKEEMPVAFLTSCISADEFLLETNKGFEIAKLNHIWSNRMAESREVIAEQLREVSSVIQNITGDIYGSAQALRMEEALVERRLKSERVLVKNIAIIERIDRRKEVFLSASATKGNCFTAKEIATIIGEVLGIKMGVSESSKTVISRAYDNFTFIEDTKFKVLTGVARTMKDKVSGDNFSLLKLESGEFMIALSDGMGTGKEAGDDSETVLSLLEQLLEAGFKTETAVKLINSSLVLKAEKQSFSTLDLGLINLFSGMCEFTKIGAASSFIKRDSSVETISSTTLPIGMFGNVDYDAVAKKLYEGDIVIMVTDGILDSLKEEDKEGCMERFIAQIHSSNPQDIANQVMNHALLQTNYVPMDDMTVIVVGIWLK